MIYNSVSLCMHITRLLSYQRQKMIQGRITTSTIAPPGEYIITTTRITTGNPRQRTLIYGYALRIPESLDTQFTHKSNPIPVFISKLPKMMKSLLKC